MTGVPDAQVFEALKSFQRDQGLKPTGAAKPGDETITALGNAASKLPEGNYIWCTVQDNRVREEHVMLEGTERSWREFPVPGGEEEGCRCWAIPVKAGPPDCRAQKEAYDEMKEKLTEIEARHKSTENELRDLIDQRDDITKEIILSFGKEVAALLVGIPFDKYGILGEIAQRVIGNAISNEIREEANKLGNELGRVKKQIAYKADQLAILIVSLNNAKSAYTDAEKALNKCIENHEK